MTRALHRTEPSTVTAETASAPPRKASAFMRVATPRQMNPYPLGVVGLQPAVLGPPAMVGRLRDLQVLGDLGHLAALGQQPVGLPELADDLLGVCRRRFIESSCPCWAVRTLTGSPSLLATRTTVGRSVWFLSGDGQGLVPLDGQYELRRPRAGRGLVTAFRETPHRGPSSEHAARASTPGQARRPHLGRGRRGRRPGDPSAPVRVRIPAGAVRAVRSDLRFDYGHLPLAARPMRSAPRRALLHPRRRVEAARLPI
jgi:hypothetical protein